VAVKVPVPVPLYQGPTLLSVPSTAKVWFLQPVPRSVTLTVPPLKLPVIRVRTLVSVVASWKLPHVPGDHGELAGDRDGGDLAAAPGGDSLVEGAQRSWCAASVPGGLDQHVPGLAGALLADPSVPGRLRTRLSHAAGRGRGS
jgi:hypothetical protein